MVPVIRVSEGNFERLQNWATPLVDSADDALGKVLEAAETYRHSNDMSIETSLMATSDGNRIEELRDEPIMDSNGSARTRLPPGIKVSNKAYERPILEAVYELGCRAKMSEVLPIVEQKMKHLFTKVDYELMPGGADVRWRNTAQWARNTLVHTHGLLKRNAGHGIWELTDKGIAEVERTGA